MQGLGQVKVMVEVNSGGAVFLRGADGRKSG